MDYEVDKLFNEIVSGYICDDKDLYLACQLKRDLESSLCKMYDGTPNCLHKIKQLIISNIEYRLKNWS